MKKLLSHLKNNRFKYTVILFILFILVLMALTIYFSINCNENSTLFNIIGAWIGCLGSIVIGMLAFYQNKTIQDKSDKQYNLSIKPKINFEYDQEDILNIKNIEKYHYVKFSKDNVDISEKQGCISDIKKYFELELELKEELSQNQAIKYLNNIERSQDVLDKILNEFVLLKIQYKNVGMGIALNVDVRISDIPLHIPFSLDRNNAQSCYMLIKLDRNSDKKKLKLNLICENINEEIFNEFYEIEVFRKDGYVNTSYNPFKNKLKEKNNE